MKEWYDSCSVKKEKVSDSCALPPGSNKLSNNKERRGERKAGTRLRPMRGGGNNLKGGRDGSSEKKKDHPTTRDEDVKKKLTREGEPRLSTLKSKAIYRIKGK